MQVVKFPGKHTAKVVEVGLTVFVAAFLWQLLQYPVAIGGTGIQQERHMIFYDRYLKIGLAGKCADTGRTSKLTHVSLFRVHFQYATYSAAIFCGDT